ncbi:MAG: phosphate transport system substrate-binding protein [Syntrophaceae bacterium]|nr:MAG: phosphate transport system substrate-binding protein [Syntrophaceae bacterium]
MFKMIKKTAFGLLVTCFAAGAVFASESIVIKGSTTVLPITQAVVETYMKANPGVQMSVSGGGSGEGIKAIIDKTTDIAMSSRAIKKEEIELAKTRGANPVEHVVGLDALIPIVHPRNKVSNLSIDQLSQIYQGKITNWKEVGGEDLKIVVISRDTSSGTFESWDHFIMKKIKVTPRAQMLASSGAVATAVAKNRYAISYVGIGYLNKSIKPLSVNGITGSIDAALDKSYPLARELYMYTNGEPQGEAAKFMTFIKSRAGQKIVAKVGFVPTMSLK